MAERKLTEAGELWYPHLLKEMTFKGKPTGKYGTDFKLSDEATESLNSYIKEVWDAYLQSEEGNKNKYSDPLKFNSPYKRYRGMDMFRFTTSCRISRKTGEVVELQVPIFDSQGNYITDSLDVIGNKSLAIINYECKPYYRDENNYGVFLQLNGLQILKLNEVTPIKNMSAFGFMVQKDYAPIYHAAEDESDAELVEMSGEDMSTEINANDWNYDMEIPF